MIFQLFFITFVSPSSWLCCIILFCRCVSSIYSFCGMSIGCVYDLIWQISCLRWNSLIRYLFLFPHPNCTVLSFFVCSISDVLKYFDDKINFGPILLSRMHWNLKYLKSALILNRGVWDYQSHLQKCETRWKQHASSYYMPNYLHSLQTQISGHQEYLILFMSWKCRNVPAHFDAA